MSIDKLSAESSIFYSSNAHFLEQLYHRYMQDKNSVDVKWQRLLEQYIDEEDVKNYSNQNIQNNSPQLANQHQNQPLAGSVKNDVVVSTISTGITSDINIKLAQLVAAYRERGHLLVKLDPLDIEQLPSKQQLKLEIRDFAISDSELTKIQKLNIANFYGHNCQNGQAVIDILESAYAKQLALQTMHMDDFAEQQWLYQSLESNKYEITDKQQLLILQDLVEIEGFEQYLHVKFPGAKRFSIEGGDSAIIALNAIVEEAATEKIDNIVFGMAHRGRLNTLTKVLGKPYKAIFSEFKGLSNFTEDLHISGDVKYHMGYSNIKSTAGGAKINISLLPNPSHLEAVNPLVMGKARAKQDANLVVRNEFNIERQQTLAVLVHGDAAFAGQGIVFETLMMSGLQAYDVGGIIHIVINNQVGFTANAADIHRGRYTTDVAKTIGAPIIHVCGDDPMAVMKAVKIAINYRNKFAKDIVLDIVCYRKYGHNEGDEPMFTQSMMYNIIKEKSTVGKIYADLLVSKNLIKAAKFDELKQEFKNRLDQQFEESKNYKPQLDFLQGKWQKIVRARDSKMHDIPTGVDLATLKLIGNRLCSIPAKFNLNSKIDKLLKDRRQMFDEHKPIDWATAEQLAYASLLIENYNIRLTGQDAGRGTFSHRHSVLHDQSNGNKYIPLNNIQEKQAYFEVADSNLSEYGVLGFEYGYAGEDPNNLVLWEAQFGDFANGAQIIFDQFIAAAETKWLRMNGIVCLLPHGYEGQGPEHSSARLERFLQLAAENNIQVVNPSCPASFFHLLRRQMLRDFRNPLIVMTPKSLLRHKLAVSNLEEIAINTKFEPVIDDAMYDNDDQATFVNVDRIILCSGKIYYDLLEQRQQHELKNVAIVRLEQYYPFPMTELKSTLKKYTTVKQVIWAQEEPENMGAWQFVRSHISKLLDTQAEQSLQYIGRPAAAATAVGYLNIHQLEQTKIIKNSLNLGVEE